MVLRRKDGDLCNAYRPQTFSEIIGQNAIVKSLRNSFASKNHEHSYLFYGERGCGKTTMARVVASVLNCRNINSDGDPCGECSDCKGIRNANHPDVKEINASSQNSVNDIRRIEQEVKLSPLFGKVKVYILDEAHRLTTEAQNALLKGAEDIAEGVYLILCSTEPKSLLPALRDRCESYNFRLLNNLELKQLAETVGVLEGFYTTDEVIKIIVESAGGRPRNVLKGLQKVINASGDGPLTVEELEGLLSVEIDIDKAILDLCRLITSSKKFQWKYLMQVYHKIKSPPETIRISLAGWFRSMLERSTSKAAADKSSTALRTFLEPLPLAKVENKLVLDLYTVYTLYQGDFQ